MCKADDSRQFTSMPSISKLFTPQVLKVDSDVTEPEEIQEAARRHLAVNGCAM